VDTNHTCISGTAAATIVQFCTHVGYINSQRMDDKSPSYGAWLGSRDPFFARRYASTGVSRYRVSVCVCVSVCLSTACIKTAKRRITQTTPRNLVF